MLLGKRRAHLGGPRGFVTLGFCLSLVTFAAMGWKFPGSQCGVRGRSCPFMPPGMLTGYSGYTCPASGPGCRLHHRAPPPAQGAQEACSWCPCHFCCRLVLPPGAAAESGMWLQRGNLLALYFLPRSRSSEPSAAPPSHPSISSLHAPRGTFLPGGFEFLKSSAMTHKIHPFFISFWSTSSFNISVNFSSLNAQASHGFSQVCP